MGAMECRACKAPLTDAHIDRDNAVICCEYCGAVFDLIRFETDMSDLEPESTPPRERPNASLPEGYTMEKTGNQLTISWAFPRALVIPVVPFALGALWIGVSGLSKDGIVALPVLAVGLALVYVCVACFINRSVLICDADSVCVRHGPLPLRRFQPTPSSLIEQVYVRKKGDAYTVFMQSRMGMDTPLLEDLAELNEALFVEEQVEKHLGIEDRAVERERWTKKKKKKKKKSKDPTGEDAVVADADSAEGA